MSAALLASLFTVIAASTALAAVTVTGVGSVPVGSTSTGTATFTLSEETAGCVTAAIGGGTGHLYIQIKPKTNPVTTTNYTRFTGTPVLTAPGSLAATVSLIDQSILAGNNDTIDIRIAGSDPINKQQITVTGLNVKVGTNTDIGAITTTINDSLAGALATCFLATTTTASGTVSAAIGIGATSVTIAVSSSAAFAVTAGTTPGKLVFATGETVTVTAAPAPVAGLQTLTISATTVVHAANEAVTQANVPAAAFVFPYALTSVGSVVDSTIQDVGTDTAAGGLPAGGAGAITVPPTSVNPGENNQPVVSTYIYERNLGFIASGTTLTFTIDAAGVLFSTSPNVRALNAASAGVVAASGMTLASNLCVVSFDRKSCTVKTSAVSTAAAAIQLYNIKVDVDATTPKGTAVNINVTGVAVSVDYNTVANVSRVIVGVAAQPTIYINYNDQATGQISLTEAGPGFFTDGALTTAANVFGLCITSGETFTRAPWAVVTTGNLLLRNGLVGGTSVQGTLYAFGAFSCAKWTVYLSSTTASTIEIRGSDASNVVLASGATNGPRLSVGSGASVVPGPTLIDVVIGTDTQVAADTGQVTKVSNAIRAFKSGVTVVALSDPAIAKGATDGLAGSVKISETLAGQFKLGEQICLTILPRTSTTFIQARQDTFLKVANTNDRPIATTNIATSGLLVSTNAPTTTQACFTVNQQAIGVLGEITISNIHLITLADAPAGPILVQVTGNGGGSVAFESIVSNAHISSNLVLGLAATRLGVTQVGSFTVSTKVATLTHYVTYRFDFGVGAAGQLVQVWGATKSGNDWSAFSVVTTRRANASGVVYYYIRQNSPSWKSYRAFYSGGGVWTPARQARWIS